MPKSISAVVHQSLRISVAKAETNVTLIRGVGGKYYITAKQDVEDSILDNIYCDIEDKDLEQVLGIKLKEKWAQVLALECITSFSPLHIYYDIPKEFGSGWVYLMKDGYPTRAVSQTLDILTPGSTRINSDKQWMPVNDDLWYSLPKIVHAMPSSQWTYIRFRKVGRPYDLFEPMPLQKAGTMSHPFYLVYNGTDYHIIPENKKPKYDKDRKRYATGASVTTLCNAGWAACAKIKMGKSHLYKARIVLEEAFDAAAPAKKGTDESKKHPVVAG